MAKIYAPNKEYTGISAGVPFVNGVGETEKPHLVEWFKVHGYEVEDDSVFRCPHCGKEYKTEKGLADHIAKEHQTGGENQTPDPGADPDSGTE